jgi:hypothetical protein
MSEEAGAYTLLHRIPTAGNIIAVTAQIHECPWYQTTLTSNKYKNLKQDGTQSVNSSSPHPSLEQL